MRLNELQARKTIASLYSNPKNWRRKEFKEAYFVLTGQKRIMSESIAKDVIEKWRDDDARHEIIEYVSAVLLITGQWILPKVILPNRMSSQIKAKYSHGNLDYCSNPKAYRK